MMLQDYREYIYAYAEGENMDPLKTFEGVVARHTPNALSKREAEAFHKVLGLR